MRGILLISSFAWAFAAFGQETAKPAMTADQVMDKSIEAAGGKAALEKMTSYVAKGTLEMSAMGVTAANETWAKAPDKRLSVTSVDGYGEVLQGVDGKSAWSKDPQAGLKDITGEQLGQVQREAAFYGTTRWKELYPKAELTGKEKAGGRDCWMVKLTPAEGKPVMHCYDAETFLVSRAVNPGPGGVEIPVELSDYKDIGNGVKTPHTIKVTMPEMGEMVIRYKEVTPNIEIDDAKFAKPKE